MPRVILGQRGAFFVAQEIQVARHGTARHLELLHEVAAVRQIPTGFGGRVSAPPESDFLSRDVGGFVVLHVARPLANAISM